MSMPDDPMTPMLEAAMGMKELYDTYLTVGFDEAQSLELVKTVAAAIAKAMHDAEIEDQRNELRAGMVRAAQDIANRMGQRPQWGTDRPFPFTRQAPQGLTNLEGVVCGMCGLVVPMDVSTGYTTAVAALYNECTEAGNQPGHAHRFPGPVVRCMVCGGPCVEEDGMMVCPDHPAQPGGPQLGGFG